MALNIVYYHLINIINKMSNLKTQKMKLMNLV